MSMGKMDVAMLKILYMAVTQARPAGTGVGHFKGIYRYLILSEGRWLGGRAL